MLEKIEYLVLKRGERERIVYTNGLSELRKSIPLVINHQNTLIYSWFPQSNTINSAHVLIAWHSLHVVTNAFTNFLPNQSLEPPFDSSSPPLDFFDPLPSTALLLSTFLELDPCCFNTGAAAISCHRRDDPYWYWQLKTGDLTIFSLLPAAAGGSLLSDDASLVLVRALLQVLLLLLVLLLRDHITESLLLLLMLLVRLVDREYEKVLGVWIGNACGSSLPLENKWSAGDAGDVMLPNSNSSESWIITGNENLSPEELFFLRPQLISMEFDLWQFMGLVYYINMCVCVIFFYIYKQRKEGCIFWHQKGPHVGGHKKGLVVYIILGGDGVDLFNLIAKISLDITWLLMIQGACSCGY